MNSASEPIEDTSGSPESARPAVAVIMPTRGRPDLVRESIAAVVAQEYAGPILCLVVHDQEPEELSLTKLGKADHTVEVTSNTRTPGLAGARNTGLGLTESPYVATCDDDDVWHPTKLAKQIELLETRPDLLVVGSGLRLRLPGGRVHDWPARAPVIDYRLLLRNRVKELHSSTLVMRRDAFAKAGLYDEALPHGYGEDYDWVLRAARVGRLGTVQEPLADIRKDVNSWYQGRSQNATDALQYLLDKHPEITMSRRGYARILGQLAFAHSSSGERAAALRTAGRGFVQWPASPYVLLGLAHAVVPVDPRRVLGLARMFGRGLG